MTTSLPVLLPDVLRVSGWTIDWHQTVDSTQTLARGRAPWSAVVADEQVAGRGQEARTFASNVGGVFLTAVLPYAGDALEARGFGLAVGWSVRELLGRAGVRRLRLRWPNDLMVGARKVGGILVEQGSPDTLLVGIGLNVTNRPWLADPALLAVAGRLADATEGAPLPEPRLLAGLVLQAIRLAHDMFALRRLEGFVPLLNHAWGPPREVEIKPARGVHSTRWKGKFRGIDGEGRVLLHLAAGELTAIPAHWIGQLREVI